MPAPFRHGVFELRVLGVRLPKRPFYTIHTRRLVSYSSLRFLEVLVEAML